MNSKDIGGWLVVFGFIGISLAIIGFAVIGVDVQDEIKKFLSKLSSIIQSVRVHLNNNRKMMPFRVSMFIFITSLILVILGYIIIILGLTGKA